MIDPDQTIFPGSAVAIIAGRLKQLYGQRDAQDRAGVDVKMRPLDPLDGMQCFGVFSVDVDPDESSIEISNRTSMSPGPQFPTLTKYNLHIQALATHTNEELGIATHATMSRIVRSVVADDTTLNVALASLKSTFQLRVETAKRWGVTRQRHLVREINAQWVYLSVTELWLETETRWES